ncbi:transporter substrate-binding domain-containing protein [Desulforhopalus singaporensis]|uniref:Amino acid ABC transporter substrate-binding protein, PAAT family n=1 Tax=Desulforhopalus singaporensis TaxID=91360 RepID=A0A1H0Q8Z3_9BACT|nr:transporter substrate-binding domain-containing protein [Desulforhopalus singaporensis]SDP13148.1 amino acid ABC transporter substrate-binding protein, PAAT family [Desulforhopalus singaporensis]
MVRNRLWSSAIALILAFCLAGISQAASIQQEIAGSSTLETIKKRGVLKVGMDIFQPWAMKDKNGQLIGFEIDVAKRLAQDMGVEVEFVPTAWSGIIPALMTGKFDVIIGGMGITAKRALQVNFTQPYEFSGMSIVAHKKLAAGFDSLEDFNSPDVEIAVKLGTTAAAAAKKFIPKAKLRMFDSEPQAYQELRNGKVHAVVGSAPRPAYEAVDYSDSLFLPFQGTFTKEPIGFALRKGDPDTLAYFNSWITVVQLEGWLDARHAYWFGTKDWIDQIQ